MKIKLLLGILPNTEKYESERIALFDEYNKFKSFTDSDEYKNFLELENDINSDGHKQTVAEIKDKQYKGSAEYQKEHEFLSQKKSKPFTTYFKFIDKGLPEWITSFEQSEAYAKILELESITTSDAFLAEKTEMQKSGKERYKLTDDYKKLQAFEELKKDAELVTYLKFTKNKHFGMFKELSGAKDWDAFLALENEVNSDSFKQQKAALGKEGYAGSEVQQKEEKYKSQLKDSRFAICKKLQDTDGAQAYLRIKESEKLKGFEELQEEVTSAAFIENKKKIEKSTFKSSEPYAKEKQLVQLKKAADYKKYKKLINSSDYKTHTEIDGSDKLKAYKELEAYLESEEFVAAKKYLLLKPDAKFKQSEAYKKEEAYQQLLKSEDIVWYNKVKNSKKFEPVKNLDISFEDDFDGNALDAQKWMTRYFWGDMLLNESFSMANDQHFVTDGDNIELGNSVLKIVTRQEEVEGKAWHNQYGFINKTFQYTSGLLNTANSFRQKYGLFEAKVKMSNAFPVTQAFWMISDKMVPHIDVAKFDKKLWMNNFWLNGDSTVHNNKKKVGGGKYASGYYIYSLEWKHGSLEWKVNGLTVAKQTTGVPDEAMYINFSSGIHDEGQVTSLPATMEVDWVRCYQFAE